MTLTAQEQSGGASVHAVMIDTAPVRAAYLSSTTHYVAAGASAVWSVPFTVLQDGVPAGGVPVTWTLTSGSLQLAADSVTNPSGVANLMVSAAAIPAGSVNTITVCAWGAVCSNWTVYGVDPSQWRVGLTSGAAQTVPQEQPLHAVVLAVTDMAGHALEQAPVQVYQRVLAWQPPCPLSGPCPAQAVLASSQTTVV